MSNLDLFSGLIGAVLGSILSNNVAKMNELDSKSGWRSKLFDLASKDTMTLDDVYLLRAALRMNKHKLPYEQYSFKYMSNQITDYCNLLVKKYDIVDTTENRSTGDESLVERVKLEENYVRVIESCNEREIIRIYARYLLKNHWEVFSKKIFFFSNEFKLRKEHELGRETNDMVKAILDIMEDNNE